MVENPETARDMDSISTEEAIDFVRRRCWPSGNDRAPWQIDDRNRIAERLERLDDTQRTVVEDRLNYWREDLERRVAERGTSALQPSSVRWAEHDLDRRSFEDPDFERVELGWSNPRLACYDHEAGELDDMLDVYSDIRRDWIYNLERESTEQPMVLGVTYFKYDPDDVDENGFLPAGYLDEYESHDSDEVSHETFDSDCSRGSVGGYDSRDSGEVSHEAFDTGRSSGSGSDFDSRDSDEVSNATLDSDRSSDVSGIVDDFDALGIQEAGYDSCTDGDFVAAEHDAINEASDSAPVDLHCAVDHVHEEDGFGADDHDPGPWLGDDRDHFDAHYDDAHHDPGPWQSDVDQDFGTLDSDAHYDPGPDLFDDNTTNSLNSNNSDYFESDEELDYDDEF